MGLHSEKGTLKSSLFLIHGCRNATPWLRNGNCLITQSQNSILGWLKTVAQKVNKTSLWKRWNPLWENSKFILQIFYPQTNLYIYNNKIGHHVGIHPIIQFLGTLCVLKIRLFENI